MGAVGQGRGQGGAGRHLDGEPTPGQEEGQLQGGGQPWPRAWGTRGTDEAGDGRGGGRAAPVALAVGRSGGAGRVAGVALSWGPPEASPTLCGLRGNLRSPSPAGGVTTSLAVTSPGDRELCPSPHPRTCSPSSPPSSHCSVTSTGAGSEGTWDGGRVRAGLIRGGRASESGGVKVEVQLPVGPGWVSEVPAPPHCWRPVSLGLGAPCK